MNRLAEWLTDHGYGEEEQGCYHWPRYTKGCWGQPGRKLCVFCKVRFITSLIGVIRRTRKIESDEQVNTDEPTEGDA